MVRFDFSQFHPLDHSIWRCHGYPGGPRRHMRYQWMFNIKPWWVNIWYHMTFRHNWVGYVKFDQAHPVNHFNLEEAEGVQYGVCCDGCDAEPDALTRARVIGNMKYHFNHGNEN